MTEIPEHLRKRAEEARKAKAAAAEPARGRGRAARPSAARRAAERGRAARSPRTCSSGPRRPRPRPAAATPRPAAAAPRSPPAAGGGAAAAAAAGPPLATGPGGHTQRLLTVVKSGSIQDVKATPQDKVHVWPHLLVVEFVAALACTAFLLVFSIFVNAPLLELANVNQTPNPSKAPWYFLGLQELLTMFHPMVAGVTIPGMGLFGLILAPVHRPQPEQQARGPQVRHLAVHDVPHVLGGAGHDRLVLPWPGLQLRLPVERRPLLRAVRTAPWTPTTVLAHRHPGPRRAGRRRCCSPPLRRRDTGAAIGALARETRKRDRGAVAPRRRRRGAPPPAARSSARPQLGPPRPASSCHGREPAPPVAVRAARPRGARRHPPPVPQPRHRRRASASAWRASAPPCSPSSGPSSAAASAPRSASASIADINGQIADGQRLRLLPRGPHVDHRVPGRRARQGRGRSTRRPSSPAWRPASSALYQKCVHLGCRVP